MSTDQLVRLVHKGTLSGSQTFSFGITMRAPSVPTQGSLDTFVAGCKTAFNTYASSAGGLTSFISSTDSYSSMRAYYYPANSSHSTLESGTTLAQAGSAVRTLPFQCALVVSLRSSVPGRTGRGRYYLPLSIAAQLAAGQVTSSNLASLGTLSAAYLHNLQQVPFDPVNGATCVVSVASLLVPRPALTIVQLIIDSVVDTQQRRRDKIAPTATQVNAVS
jgi:hypothetical protein